MTFAVRALSMLLIVWLTTAAAFPCCWSIAGAHDHHAQEKASASPEAHPHHHDDGSDLTAAPAELPLISAAPVRTCDADSVKPLLTHRTQVPSAGRLAARAGSADIVTPSVPATSSEQ